MYTKVKLLSYIHEISQLSVLQDYLKVFNSPDDQFVRAAVQKREKDQVIKYMFRICGDDGRDDKVGAGLQFMHCSCWWLF